MPDVPCYATIKKYFNSWNEVLNIADIPLNMKSPKSRVQIICANCGNTRMIQPTRISQTKRSFCSKHCAGTYNSKLPKHKTFQSKAEKQIRKYITTNYPNLEFITNNKSHIGYELDIFIPSLQLAFEINGIHHYKPIYGTPLFEKIKIRDNLRVEMCAAKNTTLIVLNISKLSQYTDKHMQPFYQIVDTAIKDHMK